MGEASFFDEAALRNNHLERKTSRGLMKSGEELSSPAAIEDSSSLVLPNCDKLDGRTDVANLHTDTRDSTEEIRTGKLPSFYVGIEEVKDEEEAVWRNKPKATKGLLEGQSDARVCKRRDRAEEFWRNDGQIFSDQESLDSDKEEEEAEADSSLRQTCESYTTELALGVDEEEPIQVRSNAEATSDTPIRLYKRRRAKAGRFTLGTLVLSMKGRVGSRNSPVVDLRLGTCVDITLISTIHS
ncbi:hypothetical protein K438DRAFT_1756246 [Mycena galopus ATCC 62051]|nr:hypothetical protein K438DRAFT_1756246 [Mycena galopus ATCC 62051]